MSVRTLGKRVTCHQYGAKGAEQKSGLLLYRNNFLTDIYVAILTGLDRP